jgi:rhodanese-related sulfurtransferase
VKAWAEAAWLIGLALIAGLAAARLHPQLRDRSRAGLEPAEVRLASLDLKDPSLLWVDARSQEDFDRGHIPCAIHFEIGAFDASLAPLVAAWTSTTKIVVYCSSTECGVSRDLALRLRRAGFPQTWYLHGGWSAWQQRK